MAKTGRNTRRAKSAIWRIFVELDKPKRTLSKMNLTSMQVSMFFSEGVIHLGLGG